MSRTYEATYEVVVTVTVNDDDAIERVVQNKDDAGIPQPLDSGAGWRDYLYRFDNAPERGAVDMLAWNLGLHDRSLRSLDGWADMDEHAVEVQCNYHLWHVMSDGRTIDE